MALAQLIDSLRSKKRSAERSAFGHYLATVRSLASGDESDADEIAVILESAGKSESDLERDVGIMQQRLAWAATLRQNQQAVQDRLQAERELADAQRVLQAAHDRLRPAVDQAHDKLNDANHRTLVTAGAESWLAGNILDHELLEREAAVVRQLSAVSSELKPLQQDRGHKADSLSNAEHHLATLTGRETSAWPGFGTINPRFWANKEITPARERVDDLKSQVAQLDAAIKPRQAEQRRLQNELLDIHRAKLEP